MQRFSGDPFQLSRAEAVAKPLEQTDAGAVLAA